MLYGQVTDKNIVGALFMVVAIAWFSVLLFGHRLLYVAAFVALLLGRGGYDTLQTSIAGDRQRELLRHLPCAMTPRSSGMRGLTHGTTLHGLQFTDRARELRPTSYYVPRSGVGLAFASDRIAGPGARIGVVGLGAGTLACYRKPGQRYDFFEIDPVMVDIARDPAKFTFLSDCAGDTPIVIGDARLKIAEQPAGRFDVLVIDAFSSDAIPLHLPHERGDRHLPAGAETRRCLAHSHLEPLLRARTGAGGRGAGARLDGGDPARSGAAPKRGLTI